MLIRDTRTLSTHLEPHTSFEPNLAQKHSMAVGALAPRAPATQTITQNMPSAPCVHGRERAICKDGGTSHCDGHVDSHYDSQCSYYCAEWDTCLCNCQYDCS